MMMHKNREPCQTRCPAGFSTWVVPEVSNAEYIRDIPTSTEEIWFTDLFLLSQMVDTQFQILSWQGYLVRNMLYLSSSPGSIKNTHCSNMGIMGISLLNRPCCKYAVSVHILLHMLKTYTENEQTIAKDGQLHGVFFQKESTSASPGKPFQSRKGL